MEKAVLYGGDYFSYANDDFTLGKGMKWMNYGGVNVVKGGFSSYTL